MGLDPAARNHAPRVWHKWWIHTRGLLVHCLGFEALLTGARPGPGFGKKLLFPLSTGNGRPAQTAALFSALITVLAHGCWGAEGQGCPWAGEERSPQGSVWEGWHT